MAATVLHPLMQAQMSCRWGQGGRQTLPLLQTLDLTGNSLTGSLPASWGQASSMSSLINLGLAKNNFNGSIPPQWGLDSNSQPRFSQLKNMTVRPGKTEGGMCFQRA